MINISIQKEAYLVIYLMYVFDCELCKTAKHKKSYRPRLCTECAVKDAFSYGSPSCQCATPSHPTAFQGGEGVAGQRTVWARSRK